MTVHPAESHFETRNMLWLELTNFCNLKCTHCYNASGPAEPLNPTVGLARYREILREARDMGFRFVQFIGGEPMFYPHLRTLADDCATLGFDEVEIYSNLTAVPGWLLLEPYRSIKIATSFYSDDPAIHDRICETPGAHARTVASLKRLVAAGFSIRAGYIEMEANAGHFERTQDYLNGIGIHAIGYDSVRGFGRGERGGEPSLAELCGHCSSGNLSVDVKGNVSGCIMSKPWAFGNVRNSDLRALFESAERRKFVRELRENLESRERSEPMMCDPYTRGDCPPQCPPSCPPQQHCNPCHPLGSSPCNPNGRCPPYDGK
jgi:MoaA/NifB/PqqE/SkfB family radical SAM enzyme